MIRESSAGVILDVRVIPRARRTELAGTRQNALLVRLAAPPVDGAANEALVRFLADTLEVPTRAIRIASGEKGREKRIIITGVRAVDVRVRLGV
ncbi:MAG: DUF167 domain-containing protein [Vicinamibacterales bacterium]